MEHTNGQKRNISGHAGCVSTDGKGGYNYEKDAKDAARKKAKAKMTSDEKEIGCEYETFQDCAEEG